MKNLIRIFTLLICLLLAQPIYAVDFDKDLSINPESVRSDSDLIIGNSVRIYTTVTNNSNQDLFGVVKFYDENKQTFIGVDQPISVLAGKTDDVFVDWTGDTVGNHEISVRVVPWHTDGDNPSNNKVTQTIYVDTDSDGDGTGDRYDIDDDNDGTPDNEDAFPYDPNESEDTDGDGIGNNVDEDDDGDGVMDTEDLFPTDANETLDFDFDGIGNNSDFFPQDPNEWADSDNDGLGDNSDPDSQNHGPLAEIETENTKVRVGEIVTLNALKSRDPDGSIVSYEWDLGDGIIETGVVVERVYEETGDYPITLTVFDDKGESRQSTVQIKVTYKWQAIAFIVVTILLVLLLLGHRLLFSGKKRSSVKPKSHASEKVTKKTVVKRKKALPRKKK